MLNARGLHNTLQGALGKGVDNVYLLSKEGSLLAAAKNADEARTCGAVLASVWVDFEAVIGEGALDIQQEMEEMVLEGESGSIVIASIGVFALCVQGSAPLGKLIATLQRTKKVLYEPLTSIQADQADQAD